MRLVLVCSMIVMATLSFSVNLWADDFSGTTVADNIDSSSPLKRGKWEFDIYPFLMGYSTLGGYYFYLDSGARYHVSDRFTFGVHGNALFSSTGMNGSYGPTARFYFFKGEKWSSYTEAMLGRYWGEGSGNNFFARASVGLHYHVSEHFYIGPEVRWQQNIDINGGPNNSPNTFTATGNIGFMF